MQAAKPDRKQGITQEDLAQIRRRVQIGDKIVCRTRKACDIESPSMRTGVRRVGTVIAKYPYFAVLRLPGGTRETIRWTEFLTAEIQKRQQEAAS